MAVVGLTPDCPSTSYVSWKNVTGGVVKKKKIKPRWCTTSPVQVCGQDLVAHEVENLLWFKPQPGVQDVRVGSSRISGRMSIMEGGHDTGRG